MPNKYDRIQFLGQIKNNIRQLVDVTIKDSNVNYQEDFKNIILKYFSEDDVDFKSMLNSLIEGKDDILDETINKISKSDIIKWNEITAYALVSVLNQEVAITQWSYPYPFMNRPYQILDTQGISASGAWCVNEDNSIKLVSNFADVKNEALSLYRIYFQLRIIKPESQELVVLYDMLFTDSVVMHAFDDYMAERTLYHHDLLARTCVSALIDSNNYEEFNKKMANTIKNYEDILNTNQSGKYITDFNQSKKDQLNHNYKNWEHSQQKNTDNENTRTQLLDHYELEENVVNQEIISLIQKKCDAIQKGSISRPLDLIKAQETISKLIDSCKQLEEAIDVSAQLRLTTMPLEIELKYLRNQYIEKFKDDKSKANKIKQIKNNSDYYHFLKVACSHTGSWKSGKTDSMQEIADLILKIDNKKIDICPNLKQLLAKNDNKISFTRIRRLALGHTDEDIKAPYSDQDKKNYEQLFKKGGEENVLFPAEKSLNSTNFIFNDHEQLLNNVMSEALQVK